MQNFSSSNGSGAASGAGLFGAVLEWASRQQAANMSSARPAPEAADTRPLLQVDARLAELLAIEVDLDGDVVPQRVARAAAVPDAALLLAPPLALAREWLASNYTRGELAEQGIAPLFVEKCLQRIADRFVRGIPARSWNGMAEIEVRLPQVPTAYDLYSYAMLDAQVAHAISGLRVPQFFPDTVLPTTPATTTTTAATAAVATTTPTTTATAPAPGVGTPLMINGYYVESTRGTVRNHAQAMEALRQFRLHIRTHLRQLGAPTVQGFWGLREGRVSFKDLNIALSTVPCGQAHHSDEDPSSVTYPQAAGSSSQLRQILVNDQEVLIARGQNPNRVVYSLSGITWFHNDIYTDDAVEAEKLVLWTGIIDASKKAAEAHRKSARWMPWRK